MNTKSSPRRYGWVAVLLGGAILFGGFGWTQVSDVYWLRQRGEVVTATVLAVDDAEVHHRRRWIDLQYVTRAGEPVVQRTSRFRHGSAVPHQLEVIYDREQPHRVQTADSGLDYTRPLAFYATLTTALLAAAVVRLLWKHPPAGY
ncbi:hypothetical protein ABZS29_13170 [Kribbella sp. NPDC005582]|uniref:hypothetical protein n=1 Tax=Kribbella sp. NPDC005582 TaxID=3156893 RepID=UPI0033BB5814